MLIVEHIIALVAAFIVGLIIGYLGEKYDF